MKIELILASKAIYEAEIQYKATGNWSENINHFGDNTQVQEMKIEVGTYLNNCSALPVMMPGILCNP